MGRSSCAGRKPGRGLPDKPVAEKSGRPATSEHSGEASCGGLLPAAPEADSYRMVLQRLSGGFLSGTGVWGQVLGNRGEFYAYSGKKRGEHDSDSFVYVAPGYTDRKGTNHCTAGRSESTGWSVRL